MDKAQGRKWRTRDTCQLRMNRFSVPTESFISLHSLLKIMLPYPTGRQPVFLYFSPANTQDHIWTQAQFGAYCSYTASIFSTDYTSEYSSEIKEQATTYKLKNIKSVRRYKEYTT